MPAGSLPGTFFRPLEATIPFSKLLRASVVVVAVLALAVAALPASADTASDLETAKQQADSARADLDRIAAQWQDAEAQLAQAQDTADAAAERIAELQDALVGARKELDKRAAELYMAGGSQPVIALITSTSLAEATDRLQYASALAQQDTDLASRVSVQSQELTWQQEQLAGAIAQRTAALSSLRQQEAAIRAKVTEYEARAADLQQRLDAQQAAAAAATGSPQTPSGGSTSDGTGGTGGAPPPVSGSGWLQTCPVNGPTSFVDSFGDPRPGGRSHEGIDMIAGFGTPVVAVHSGTVHRTSSSTGGYGTVIFHDGSADWTFYTHFSSYAGPGEGSHVSAGETIGLVGSTGDTSVNHLHFEYHPGGGVAVDPYTALLGIC